MGRGEGRGAGVVNVSVRVIPGFVRRDILMDPWKWTTSFTSFGKASEHGKTWCGITVSNGIGEPFLTFRYLYDHLKTNIFLNNYSLIFPVFPPSLFPHH